MTDKPLSVEEKADIILSLLDVHKNLLKDGVFEAVVLELKDLEKEAIQRDRDQRMAADLYRHAYAKGYQDAKRLASA